MPSWTMSIFLSNSTISSSGVGNFFCANLPSNHSAQQEDNIKINLPSISELVQLAGGKSFPMFSVEEISRADVGTTKRRRPCTGLGFPGARLFLPLEGSGF